MHGARCGRDLVLQTTPKSAFQSPYLDRTEMQGGALPWHSAPKLPVVLVSAPVIEKRGRPCTCRGRKLFHYPG